MRSTTICFNPSVGILFVHTHRCAAQQRRANGFNPSVGILFVHTTGVSNAPASTSGGFNPSVGILFVHTRLHDAGMDDTILFQSLGRDSVCSYEDYSVDELAEEMFQSLGRDSVCSYYIHLLCAKPPFEFQSLGRDSVCSY